MPKLVSKALTILETAGAVNDMDILPEPVREEHSLMPWLQVYCARSLRGTVQSVTEALPLNHGVACPGTKRGVCNLGGCHSNFDSPPTKTEAKWDQQGCYL